jgi:glycosyltransferase involved in cell wall biosynthesis
MFTSKGNCLEWLEQKVIKDEQKCHEVLEASTYISPLNKQQSREQLNMDSALVFLWVGRLNENKDPLTVVEAFAKYLSANNNAALYMIYQTEELLAEIKELLDKNLSLKKAVVLVGKVGHERMALWYSAADFYISASHREGSGYALLEALSCGCIPIVTSIPSFKKITSNGEIGFIYPPGDVEYLVAILKYLPLPHLQKLSEKALTHLKENLSFKNIANDIYDLCRRLKSK